MIFECLPGGFVSLWKPTSDAIPWRSDQIMLDSDWSRRIFYYNFGIVENSLVKFFSVLQRWPGLLRVCIDDLHAFTYILALFLAFIIVRMF